MNEEQFCFGQRSTAISESLESKLSIDKYCIDGAISVIVHNKLMVSKKVNSGYIIQNMFRKKANVTNQHT